MNNKEMKPDKITALAHSMAKHMEPVIRKSVIQILEDEKCFTLANFISMYTTMSFYMLFFAVKHIEQDLNLPKNVKNQLWPNCFYSLGETIKEDLGFEPYKVTDYSSVRAELG